MLAEGAILPVTGVQLHPVGDVGPTRAIGSVTIGNAFEVYGVRVVEREKGPCVALPQRKEGDRSREMRGRGCTRQVSLSCGIEWSCGRSWGGGGSVAEEEMDRLAGDKVTRKSRRPKLRLRISCSKPDPLAEQAWTEFLIRLLRKGASNE